jgi:hypothetical protein
MVQTRFLRGGALWDHVFPFSRQTGLGVEGSDGKNCHTPTPATTELPVLTWPDPARWGPAAMRGEGRTGSAYETGGGQELAF